VEFPPGVPNSLFEKFNAKHEDQGTHDANRDEADHRWSGHPDSRRRNSKGQSSPSAVSTILDEKDAVRVDEVVLDRG
jgi:hypothetical protein